MLTIKRDSLQWKKEGPTRMRSRVQLGSCLLNILAIKVKIVEGAYVEACSRDDNDLLQVIHFLMTNPGMPETLEMFGAHWVVTFYPAGVSQ